MNTKERGFLIAIEGIDGSGKTTLLKILENYFQKKEISVFALPSGGFSPLDVEAQIRKIVVAENSGISKETETLLYISGLAQKVGQYIEPALKRNKVVIIDRFLLSTLVLVCCMNGLEKTFAENILEYASNGLKPDFTFLCDIDEDIAYSRMISRGQPLSRREKKGQPLMRVCAKVS